MKVNSCCDRTSIRYEEYYLFRDFLISTGKFEIEETKGKYEALRARYIGKPNKRIKYKSQKSPLILYFRDKGCGFTIQNYYAGSGLFQQYTEYKKKLGYDDYLIDFKLQREVLNMLEEKNKELKGKVETILPHQHEDKGE